MFTDFLSSFEKTYVQESRHLQITGYGSLAPTTLLLIVVCIKYMEEAFNFMNRVYSIKLKYIHGARTR